MLRKKVFLMLWVSALVLSSCRDVTLHKAASLLDKIASTEKLLEDTTLQMNRLGTLSDEETRPILSVIVQVESARSQAAATTRALAKLDPQSKMNLGQLIRPIAQSLDVSTIEQLSAVKNPNSRAQLKVILLSLQALLNSLASLFS